MIRDRLIVCIASAWDYDPTSKHHVMKILARHNDVLWVNYHGTRRPGLNGKDVRGSISALRCVARGVSRISDSMWQVTPFVIPGAKRRILAVASRAMLAGQIKRAVRKIRKSPTTPVQLWTFAPDVPDLIGRFDEECSIYYCVDEFSQFAGADRERIRLLESRTLKRADIVVATSQALVESRRTARPDTVLVPHGVDFDHFAAAWRESQTAPPDLQAVARPIIGFFGLIEHWIDIALLTRAARSRPEYSFVFIGEQRADVTPLRALPNVLLLGRRPYADLPAYAASFDVALLPFVQSSMTRNVNPIKMQEYLAAGVRVVSTPLPEAKRYPEHVLIAEGVEAFAAACDRIIAEKDQYPHYVVARTVLHETWASRVAQLTDLVTRTVETRGGIRSRRVEDLLPSVGVTGSYVGHWPPARRQTTMEWSR